PSGYDDQLEVPVRVHHLAAAVLRGAVPALGHGDLETVRILLQGEAVGDGRTAVGLGPGGGRGGGGAAVRGLPRGRLRGGGRGGGGGGGGGAPPAPRCRCGRCPPLRCGRASA